MNEGPIETEEEVINRHKQEKKELQSKIQALKKSVPKGDKKKKKEVTDQIAELEREIEERHNQEVQNLTSNGSKSICESEESSSVDVAESGENVRVSRAQKRRMKKASEEKERDKRIAEQAEKNRDGPRVTEMNSIKAVLETMGLQLYDIAADGNCLYCAINHQLHITGQETYTVPKLRKLTANFMKEHKEDFMPFMYNESDEPVSEDYFQDYCKEVANTKLWGGQLELKALSNILKCPIKIIQASGPPTVQGENLSGPELILAYHRHLYRLGEHYNSTIKIENL